MISRTDPVILRMPYCEKTCGFYRWGGVLFLPCNDAVAIGILLVGQREKSVRPKKKNAVGRRGEMRGVGGGETIEDFFYTCASLNDK